MLEITMKCPKCGDTIPYKDVLMHIKRDDCNIPPLKIFDKEYKEMLEYTVKSYVDVEDLT